MSLGCGSTFGFALVRPNSADGLVGLVAVFLLDLSLPDSAASAVVPRVGVLPPGVHVAAPGHLRSVHVLPLVLLLTG